MSGTQSASSQGEGPSAHLPAALESRLPQWLGPGERVIAAVGTDMSRSGRYREGWLFATDQRFFVVMAGDSRPRRELSRERVESLELQHFIGNGSLLARCGAQTTELIRFSRSVAHRVEAFVAAVSEQMGRHPSDAAATRSASQRAAGLAAGPVVERCPRCGGLLRRGICPACLDRRKILVRLFGYVKPHAGTALLCIAIMLAITALDLTPAILTKTLIDGALEQRSLALLEAIVLAIAGVHLLRNLLNGWRRYLLQWLGQRITSDLRSEVYRHLQRLSLGFYQRVRTGSVMSRLTNDTGHIRSFVVNGLQQMIQDVATMIGIGIALVAMDWQLALVALLPAPLVAVGTRLYSARVKQVYRRLWVRSAALNALLADTIPGITVVKAFAKEDAEVARFDTYNDHVFREQVTAGKFQSIFAPTIQFVTTIGAVFVWGVGGYLVITSDGARLSVGTLVAFISLMNRFYSPVRNLSNLSNVLQQAATAAERVFEILDTQPERPSGEVKPALGRVRGHIRFENVSFAYQPDEPVLKEINLEIRPGEMVGLVGASGSGKTTIVNLIPRLFDVTSGRVTIDGRDVRDVDLHSLRSQIGIVLQEPFLFHGSIAENIAYGKPGATMEEIIAAAIAANAHDFIMEFPDAYDTRVGERGIGLSGGQKQRLSIARAILMDPRILILDEATSAVDTETEKLIQQALDRLVKNRTTIAIAHRLSTLQNADRLIVMEGGRIVESGTHAELMARDGIFRRLVEMQTEIRQGLAVS